MGKFKVGFREKTSLNILTNVIRTLAMTLIGIFMTPYYVDQLGIASYAIIPLATTMASYIQIISDSMAYASIRFNSIAFNKNDEEEANRTFSSAFFGLGRITIMIVPIAIVISLASPVIFDISGSTATEVQIMFAMILISSLIVTHSVTFNGVFYASNDLYLLYFAKFSYSIAQISIILLMFSIHTPSLVDIGAGYLVASMVVYLIQYILALHLRPTLNIKKSLYDRELFKQIGSLGIWSILAKIGGMLYIELSMILVNMYLGSKIEGGFALVSTMISMINTACYTVTGSIDPFLYKYYAEEKLESLNNILYTGTKFAAVMMAFPIVFVIAFSDEFLSAWVGQEYVYLSDIVLIGFLGNLAFCIVSTMSPIPRIFLKIKRITVYTIALGLLNGILLIFLLPTDNGNVQNAMWIWSFCIVVLAVYTATYDAKITNVKWYRYLIPLGTGYLIMIVCYPILRFIRELINIPGQWIPLIVVALVLYAAYFIVAYMLVFSSKEKDMVSSLLPKALAKHLPRYSLR